MSGAGEPIRGRWGRSSLFRARALSIEAIFRRCDPISGPHQCGLATTGPILGPRLLGRGSILLSASLGGGVVLFEGLTSVASASPSTSSAMMTSGFCILTT
eukprot:scaffold34082_cov118-Isochrysis_galbana.AAC.1